jgi:hypothetical protein
LGIWGLFFLLVAAGIHGSSIPAIKGLWAPGNMDQTYLFEVLPWRLQRRIWGNAGLLRDLAMANARAIRSDELVVDTPFALSQLAHDPPFPVINTNFGQGQNMLLLEQAPVWHITLLARPVTWGYFLLGAQRGLAWNWWFQVFACFTVLWLLLEVILRGHSGLAAFGAFWFCASAFVVCWSLWPAYAAFFPCLGCLALYHLLVSSQPKIHLLCGVLAGLSFPGLLMFLYPPWQVALGYLSLLLFAGLFIRDRLYEKVKALAHSQIAALAIALLLAGGLSAAFLVTCWPALRAMSQSVYPGARLSTGGDYSLAMLLKGIYNLRTIYEYPAYFYNECVAASFYYLFPPILIAAGCSRWWARRLGAVGWALIFYIAGLLWFVLVGIPAPLAKLTLLSQAYGLQADIGLGLASITLCVYALAQAPQANEVQDSWTRLIVPLLASGGTVLLYLLHGQRVQAATQSFPPGSMVLFAALLAGAVSYALLTGYRQSFCITVGLAVVATSAFFNPLATRLDYLYDNELAQQIKRLNHEAGGRPLWACYDTNHTGMLVGLLGGRTLSFVQVHPQLDLWHVLDPKREQEFAYNRYAHVLLRYGGEQAPVKFQLALDVTFVEISPNHPGLRSLGVQYILAVGDEQRALGAAHLQTVYQSPSGRFSIFEYPAQTAQPSLRSPQASP